MKVRLIAKTVGVAEAITAQELISYVARVSNPSNQGNFDTAPKLLRYLIKHAHWSPFEHAYMTVEIVTSRAIAAQILRHRSFVFQEFSQRYAEALAYEPYEARRQDLKNRQNSVDDLDAATKNWFAASQDEIWQESYDRYRKALDMGIAKEQARFLLPLNTQTTMYMTGSCRSWIHYVELRADAATQKEHRDIALAIREIFKQEFPDVYAALEEMRALAEQAIRRSKRIDAGYDALKDYFRLDACDFVEKYGIRMTQLSDVECAEAFIKGITQDW